MSSNLSLLKKLYIQKSQKQHKNYQNPTKIISRREGITAAAARCLITGTEVLAIQSFAMLGLIDPHRILLLSLI
jgi:hypothetical protein